MQTAIEIKIGASDVPAALGVSPYKTKAELGAELLGKVEPKPVNQAACDIGNRIEPFLAAEYQEKTGIILRPSRSKRGQPGYIHPEREWLEVHPDFESDSRLVELKTVNPRMAFRHWGDDGDPEGVPYYVLAQVVTQVACHPTLDRVDVAAYFGGGDFRVFPIEPRTDVIDAVMGGLDRFYQTLMDGDIPMPTDKDLDLVKRLYSTSNGQEVVADLTARHWVERYKEAQSLVAHYEKELDTAKVQIQQFMGDNEVLTDSEGIKLFTWRKAKDGQKVDWKAVCQEAGIDQAIIDKYTKATVGSRRFLSKIKDGE